MALQLSTEYEGLKHDISVLFANFHQRQSVRFEVFCEEWKALNFNCIFGTTYINKPTSKMRIIERLFRVASEFLSEESTFLYKVAAIYTFYAVYFKQITHTKVCIRMTPTMWNDLLEFFAIVKEHQHHDVAYVIEVLRKHKAFVFCAFPKELLFGRLEFMLGVDGSAGYCHIETNDYASKLIDGTNNFQQELKDIQSAYDEVKQKVLEESTEEEIPDLKKVLFYSNTEFPVEISKIIQQHKRKHFAGRTVKPDSKDSTQRPVISQLHSLEEETKRYKSEEQDTEQKNHNDVLKVLKLKEKIWANDIKKGKGMRYAPETAVEPTSTDPDSSPNKDNGDDNSVFYKRSAMLHPLKKKRAPYKITKSLRYKPPAEPNV